MKKSIRKKILKEGEIIPLIYDFSFTEIFNNVKNLPILERFISDYMVLDLRDVKGNIEIVSRRLPSKNKKEIRKEVDIILNYKGEKIEIELNGFGPYKRVNDRNLVYISKILGENYEIGEEIKKAHQINISNYPCNEKKLINEYYLLEKDNKEEIFSEKLQIDQIDVSKCIDKCYNFKDEREKRIAKWIKLFLSNNLEELSKIGEEILEKEELEELKDNLEELSIDKGMVDIMKRYEDNFDLYDDAKELGFESGVEQGIEQGIEQGSKEKTIEIVKKLFEKDMDIETISEITNLSVKEIEEIKNNKRH